MEYLEQDEAMQDELRALQDPIIRECCMEIDRMFTRLAGAVPEAPSSLEHVLTRSFSTAPVSLYALDLSFLNEFQREYVERHLFSCCLDACALTDRAIASVEPHEITQVRALLAQCGYELDFFVDDEQYLNYRLYPVGMQE